MSSTKTQKQREPHLPFLLEQNPIGWGEIWYRTSVGPIAIGWAWGKETDWGITLLFSSLSCEIIYSYLIRAETWGFQFRFRALAWSEGGRRQQYYGEFRFIFYVQFRLFKVLLHNLKDSRSGKKRKLNIISQAGFEISSFYIAPKCCYNSNNNGGLLNTCCGISCELIHVYSFKVGNRKYKNKIYLKLI